MMCSDCSSAVSLHMTSRVQAPQRAERVPMQWLQAGQRPPVEAVALHGRQHWRHHAPLNTQGRRWRGSRRAPPLLAGGWGQQRPGAPCRQRAGVAVRCRRRAWRAGGAGRGAGGPLEAHWGVASKRGGSDCHRRGRCVAPAVVFTITLLNRTSTRAGAGGGAAAGLHP